MNGWEWEASMDVWTAPFTCHDSWHVCVTREKNILLHQSQNVPIFLTVWIMTGDGSLQFSGSRQFLMSRVRAGSGDTFTWRSEDSLDLIPVKFFLVASHSNESSEEEKVTGDNIFLK